MTSGKHAVVINLSWPTKGYITLKKQTLMFCKVLKHANFPFVCHYIYLRSVDDRAVLNFLQNVLLRNICFCGDLKMLETPVSISKHLWILWQELQKLNFVGHFFCRQKSRLEYWILDFKFGWSSANFLISLSFNIIICIFVKIIPFHNFVGRIKWGHEWKEMPFTL